MAMNSPHSQVNISIESLASSFKKMLADHNLSMPPKVSIFEVPKILLRHNPLAYEPNAFSIGPFRYGQEQLKPTEKIKLKYLQGLLRRSGKPEELMLELIGAVSAIAAEARQCYAGSSIGKWSDEEFVKILVLDGCFIIELFRKDAVDEVKKDPDDPIFSMSCLLEFLKHDLILLENQIPWPVLECLFKLTMDYQQKNLIELALNFFGNMFTSHKPSITSDLFAKHEIKHILDLLRLSLILPLDQSNRSYTGWQPFPTARKIKDFGIKFKKVAAKTILDIRFNNGCLEIPTLLVQETTETIFRNLISLEQCLPKCPPIITSYAKLMDNLIDKTEDVEILCDNEVLDNWLNPEDATRFFNKLYNDAYLKTFYYHDVCHKVNDYSKKWWPKWRNSYIQNYFTRPWVIVSQIVAVIFLILGFVQTFYSIASYLSQKGESSQN